MGKKKDKERPLMMDEVGKMFSPLYPGKLKPGHRITYDFDGVSVSFSGAGRKKTGDVPQSDVVRFITDHFHEYLHTNDRYGKKGEPNFNKLAEAYLKEHPEIEEGEKDKISKRRLVIRLEEAYETVK